MRKRNIAKLVFLLVIISLNVACSNIMREESLGVTLTGVHHLGKDYSIREFYVDSAFGGDIGRGGGGGSYACCMMLPEKWRKDLTVVVKWSVSNWKNANPSEMAVGNFTSVKKEGIYIATVPIEKYINAENLYVHFFANGKVRVVSSIWGALQEKHPINKHQNEEATAIQGVPISDFRSGNLMK